ncbi:hypothetical protein AHF37_02613 [Paragonimus kellicotti]|nr:hypothetical protein AHF37_02613 [Paragonimus kellicotti]
MVHTGLWCRIRQHLKSSYDGLATTKKALVIFHSPFVALSAEPAQKIGYDGLIIFTFIVVGGILSMLIFVLCGCRRTIWYRYGNRQAQENLTLVNMPANYEI